MCPGVGLEGWPRWLAQSLLNHFSRVQLFVTPWTVAHQTPLSMEFSRQEYWSGWPFPPPGDLPDPGLRWCCVQGACMVPCFCSQPPAFAPGASEWLLGFLASLCLLSRICPTAHTCSYSSCHTCRCVLLLKETEKAMAPHSSTLAWKTPWTEEPGGLQSMGSLRVGHDCSDLAAAAA